MPPFLDRQLLVEVIGGVKERPRLVSSGLMQAGARISGLQSLERIGWHHHVGWDAVGLKGRDRIERLLAGVYVNGTLADAGAVITLPRRFHKALQ